LLRGCHTLSERAFAFYSIHYGTDKENGHKSKLLFGEKRSTWRLNLTFPFEGGLRCTQPKEGFFDKPLD
jgi:hypothetical protein